MAKLIVVEGPGVGSEYDLEPNGAGASFTVGRDPQAEVALQDGAVSRRHFRIDYRNGAWWVADLGSRNQTFLNGKPVREAALGHGDTLRVGDCELRFENPGAPVESTGILSTIIKEMPADRKRDSIAERLDHLEKALKVENPVEARQRIRRLLELYGELGTSKTSQELLERLLGEIVPALGADRAAVILREKERWVARASRTASADAGEENGDRIHASTSIIEKVAEEGKAIISADTTSDERFRKKESIVAEEIVSAVAAPISLGGKTAGVLYADRRGEKPSFTDDDLEFLVAAAYPVGSLLEKISVEEELRRENRNLFRSITDSKKIIGKSRGMEQVLEFIRKAAPTPMTVLVQGETGTGKELVASAIHYSSPRRGRPFVAINCAALPENLVESELFGHERGAFTGAVTRRKGRFELADTGTVFLDEVGELSLPCQAKLLRLLEEKVFERVGGVETVRVDVRILAATNKDLLEAVNRGAFREDLYYRLSVLNVCIPSLRERPEDIPLLAEHFLRECCGGIKKLGKAAEKKLMSYHWPGNARQLRNVIESAVVLGEAVEIRAEDIVLPEPGAKGPGAAPSQAGEEWQPMSLGELERIHIERVLRHTAGNKKKAAEILGIERCTLYAKLKSYGL